jgi:hypothetical protein
MNYTQFDQVTSKIGFVEAVASAKSNYNNDVKAKRIIDSLKNTVPVPVESEKIKVKTGYYKMTANNNIFHDYITPVVNALVVTSLNKSVINYASQIFPVYTNMDAASGMEKWYRYVMKHENLEKKHYQFGFEYMKTSESGSFTKEDLSTGYIGSDQTIDDKLQEIIDYLSEDESNPYSNNIILRLWVREIAGQDFAGRGGQTYTQITDKYIIISPESVTNCLWTSLAIIGQYAKNRAMLDDKKVQNAAGSKLKCTVKPTITTYSDKSSIAEFCAYYKTSVTLYNNIFEKEIICPEFKNVNNYRVQLTHIKSAGHFVALIKKSDLLKVYPDYQFVEKIKIEDFTSDVQIRKYESKSAVTYDKTIYVAYDIETFKAEDGCHKAYKIGIAYFDETGNKVYEHFDGLDCIVQFMDYLVNNIEIFDKKYFYAHNGGKFDLNILIREGFISYKKNGLGFNIDASGCTELNGSWIGFTVLYGKNIIRFRDSYRLLSGSLGDICKDVKTEHQKLDGDIQHHLVNINTYTNYIKGGSECTKADKYLLHDCLGLLEVLEIFSEKIAKENIYMYSCLTAASLAKKSFYRNYYPDHKDIYSLSNTTDKFIRNGYFGGMVQCFALGRVIKPIYYYDATSLYPDQGRKQLPYNKPIYENTSFALNHSRFKQGFIRCIVTGTREMLGTNKPLHAVMTEGKLEFPYVENVEMTLYKPEIEYGKKLGYTYKFIDGYRFASRDFLKQCFEDAVKKKTEAKANGDSAMEFYYKIIANSTYGFFGFRRLDRDGIILGEDLYYQDYLDQGKLMSFGELNDEYQILRVKKDLPIKDVNVSVAAAITSYSRMRTYSIINKIEKLGGKVYYCDTDSIITDFNIKSNEELLDEFQPDRTGDALGSWKNECLAKCAKKYKGDKKSVLDKQIELEGELHFDELRLTGCKAYSVTKKMNNGDVIEINKLKGFSGRSYDANGAPVDNHLTTEHYDTMIDGDTISQIQLQLSCSKTAMIKDGDKFGIKHSLISKKFNATYTKGTYDEKKLKEDGYVDVEVHTIVY